jgi:hypothetical protein
MIMIFMILVTKKKFFRVCTFMNMTTIAQLLFICMIYLLFYLVSLSLSLSLLRLAVHVRLYVGSGVGLGENRE